jgi:hypothetical protein
VLVTEQQDATRAAFQTQVRSKGPSDLMVPSDVIIVDNYLCSAPANPTSPPFHASSARAKAPRRNRDRRELAPRAMGYSSAPCRMPAAFGPRPSPSGPRRR